MPHNEEAPGIFQHRELRSTERTYYNYIVLLATDYRNMICIQLSVQVIGLCIEVLRHSYPYTWHQHNYVVNNTKAILLLHSNECIAILIINLHILISADSDGGP